MLPETMDERFASLEEKLIKEFADIKWLLYSVLEQHPGHPTNLQNVILYNNAFNSYSSPRQNEIDRYNNTLQNLSTISGQCSLFKLTIQGGAITLYYHQLPPYIFF